MLRKTRFYIDGHWCEPQTPRELEVINPADEQPYAVISMGSEEDVDIAVSAARRAFPEWSTTPHVERIAAVERLLDIYKRRSEEMAKAISEEMGAPIRLALEEQTAAGSYHIRNFIHALKSFEFETPLSDRFSDERIIREPIGVCGLITPWNWPMNQVALKVVPAVGVGCTVVLKPSEIAPISSIIFAEMMDEAGFPAGVFNLINGDGPTVGEAMSRHPDIDMMSFTGSTRAGVAVTKAAADTVKRVSLELGGKSPNLIFADTDVEAAVVRGLDHCFENTGQSCNAPTRMLVERPVYEEAVEIAERHASSVRVGNPAEDGSHIGPLVSQAQFDKVQGLIEVAIKEGARLVSGGPGRPEGFNRGYYVRPTVFADVTNDMTIAREEVFGPVLAMIPFETEEEAIAIANDTVYGLSSYIQTGDPERARRVARQLRSGMVNLNGKSNAPGSPFGGYKQSGNGREGGQFGLEEFLEVKAVAGWPV
ncbi:aldehyde dehydrogenase family protein [Aquamicrobium zhengzhouense]|uniref:aldehyde dehydrogenase (NAD(+)) n=1 Tax=Aquamicrobium zhengzhouense TaxID=2781738 RepID=A0ABS0S8L3_9HYPH|nr:aldehyde dehydrogenase family protein [Aquamicrobium zhengzhouense]MBI1619634.1 aldehyde dehydrogenase family protein [Aquamicrobium zhengzhouense]